MPTDTATATATATDMVVSRPSGCRFGPDSGSRSGPGRRSECGGSRLSSTWLSILIAAGCAGSGRVEAENWRFTSSAGISGTYTDNVSYAPRDGANGDFVTSLTAALGINGEGKRVKLNGTVAATAQLYASETQNNAITPNVNLVGSVEAIERFLFIDATANVTTAFLSPFGPQPGSAVNATSNRYTSQTYSVSPYVKGEFGATGITYEVRYANTWTLGGTYGDSSTKPPDTYLNTLSASLTSPASPLGWRLEYERNDYDNGLDSQRLDNAGNYLTQVARAIFTRQFDGQLQVSVRGGYDMAEFPLTRSDGPVYGVGLEWNPTERTQMGGFWEHRFFGSSYEWRMRHRLPNSAIKASFTRGLASFPQNALAIPAGAGVAQFVDAAFTSRIPDPVARAQAVEQFLARSGLPSVLTSPVNIYSTQVQLQTAQDISFVVVGRRNSVTLSMFNVKTQAITGTGELLPPALQFSTSNTQTGGGITFNHQLSSFTGMNAYATLYRTRSNDSDSRDLRSDNGDLGINLSTSFSQRTTGAVGVTYSAFKGRSTANQPDTDAISIFASVNHSF